MSNTLSELVGNAALKKRLITDIRKDSLSHAYIIEGRKGCGKHTVARMLAAAINCENRREDSDAIPCLKCERCRKILEDLSQDVITVGREPGKATLGVEAVRAVRAEVATVPGEFDYKIYVIEDADTLTVQAQNALLLTLEEPPSFVLFLLLCENARALLETIRSRAPTLRVEPLPRETVSEHVLATDPRARLVKNTAPSEFEAILTAADGSIGEAMRLLDPKERKAFLDTRETAESFVNACAAHSSCGDLLAVLAAFPQKRPELIAELSVVMTAIRDLIVLSRADTPHLTFYTDREAAAEKAGAFSITTLTALFEAVDRAIDALLRNGSVSLTLINLATEASA